MALLEARAATLDYGPVRALDAVDLGIGPAEKVAVMGPSGSGKSSLLHLLGGVLTPTSGEIHFDGQRLDSASEAERARIRLRRMGMVFQFGDLLPELTLLENVTLPLQILRSPDPRAQALTMMDRLGIADEAPRRAGAVSGGQAQRAAVARALVASPAVVLADEPTGALDSLTSEVVMDLMVEVAAESGAALVVVTHDNVVASHLDRIVVVRDGRITTESVAEPAPEPVR